MPGGLKKKELRTELDLTPKQKMFVEIYVKDWGSITQAEALKRAGYVCTNEKIMALLHLECYRESYIPILQNILINYLKEKLKNTKVTTLEDIKG